MPFLGVAFLLMLDRANARATIYTTAIINANGCQKLPANLDCCHKLGLWRDSVSNRCMVYITTMYTSSSLTTVTPPSTTFRFTFPSRMSSSSTAAFSSVSPSNQVAVHVQRMYWEGMDAYSDDRRGHFAQCHWPAIIGMRFFSVQCTHEC
jgi:hypothetical protein